MRKFGILSLLVIALTIGTGISAAFADDQSATPATSPPAASSTMVADPGAGTAAMLPAHTTVATPAATVTTTTMPALQGLPADKSVGSVLLWILAGLFPWLGWLISEILPFLPGKVNGIGQGIVTMLKVFSSLGQNDSVLAQVTELKAAISEIKGQLPTSGTGA